MALNLKDIIEVVIVNVLKIIVALHDILEVLPEAILD